MDITQKLKSLWPTGCGDEAAGARIMDDAASEITQLRHDVTRLIAANSELAGEVEVMRVALRWIDDACPVTCDMTLAHEMAEVAHEALAKVKEA